MRLLIVAALLAQEADELKNVTILKAEKVVYLSAMNTYKDAEKLLESDPGACAEKCSTILDGTDVRDGAREVMLRIQKNDGSYGEFERFTPYQLRGRARLARAQALAGKTRDEAIKFAQDAIGDLDESIKRGAKSSRPHRETAEKLVASLKEGPKKDPRVEKAEQLMAALRLFVETKPAADAILKKCDEIAAEIKETPSEPEFRLIRERAERQKAEERRSVVEKALEELRKFAATKPDPTELIRRCDAFAKQHPGVEGSAEVALMREAAAGERLDAWRAAWSAHCDEGRFASARKHVEGGSFLAEADRAKYAEQTASRCGRFADLAADRFVRALRETLQPDDALAPLLRTELEALPEAAELIVENARLDWCRTCRAALDRLRQGAPKAVEALGALAAVAAAAVPLGGEGENKMVVPIESLAFDIARRRLDLLVTDVSAATPAERRSRQAEAVEVVKAFAEFAAKLEPIAKSHAFIAAHRKRTEELMARFPIDPARIDEIAGELDRGDDKGVFGASPVEALEALSKELARIDRTEGTRLSKESRLTLVTCQLVASAMRRLFAGEKVAEAAKADDVREAGRRAWELGAPSPAILDRCSPKIQEIARLTKP
jgi:hypothetical protein